MTRNQLLAAMRSSLEKCTPQKTQQDIMKASALLESLLQHEGYPEDYFCNFCGAGSYKEAWQVGSICIKFATDEIQNEIDVYYSAEQYGIQHLFCPTYFHRIPDNIKIYLTEINGTSSNLGRRSSNTSRTEHDDSEQFPRAEWIIIQPLIEVEECLTCCSNPYKYEANPLYLNDGTSLSGYEYCQIDAPYEWRQSIIKQYGDLGYRDAVWGLRRLEIEDLHSTNVGWLNDKPLILDWLSNNETLLRPKLH